MFVLKLQNDNIFYGEILQEEQITFGNVATGDTNQHLQQEETQKLPHIHLSLDAVVRNGKVRNNISSKYDQICNLICERADISYMISFFLQLLIWKDMLMKPQEWRDVALFWRPSAPCVVCWLSVHVDSPLFCARVKCGCAVAACVFMGEPCLGDANFLWVFALCARHDDVAG